MILKTPHILPHSCVRCRVKGLHLRAGDLVRSGDCLAELRYEVVDGEFSDCPVVYYGDLVAKASGVVMRVEESRSGLMGMSLGEIGDEPGEFPVVFESF